MKKKNYLVRAALGVTAYLIVSCSNSGSGPPVKTPDQLLAEGWQAYSQKNYQSARNSFGQAISARSGFTDAYNGAGWSDAKLNNMSEAANDFLTGYGTNSTNQQIRGQIGAGMGFVLNTQKNYQESLYWSGLVLQSDSNWTFTRDLSLTSADLFILRAEDYFALARFDSSLMEVQKLDARDTVSFAPDVSTDLGRIELAAEIERLQSIH